MNRRRLDSTFGFVLFFVFLIQPLGCFVRLIPALNTNKSIELRHFSLLQNPRMLPHRGGHNVPSARTSTKCSLSVRLRGSAYAFFIHCNVFFRIKWRLKNQSTLKFALQFLNRSFFSPYLPQKCFQFARQETSVSTSRYESLKKKPLKYQEAKK